MEETFPILPASSGPIWMLAGVAVFVGSLLALFGWLTWSSRHGSISITGSELRVGGVMYGRAIPLSRITIDDARPISLDSGAHRLVRRTNGAGLPGFLAGWFRSADGEKVLAFVTDRRSVAHLPTTEGYALMVSVADPDALIAAVRRAGHAPNQ